jgi:hypothetical protein
MGRKGYNLLPNLTVKENIEAGAKLAKNPLDINQIVNTYTPLLVFGYLLALPISMGLMNVLKIELETKFELPMMLSLGIVNGLLGLAVLMLTYFAGLRISRWNINRIF